MCVPLTDVAKCPHWLALLGFIYLFCRFTWTLDCLLMHRESFVQVSCFVLLLSNTHSHENKHTVCLTRCRAPVSSPVCHVLLHCIPLGISKVHEKSVQISCSFWNFPGIRRFVDCLRNLLHVGERDLGLLLCRGFLLPVMLLSLL